MTLRSWRFGSSDPQSAAAGLRLERGAAAMVAGDAAVRQGVLLLLATRPGERAMRPDYGCDLGRLVFAPNDATTAGLAMHYVRAALERWEPRVEVVALDAGPDPDDAARLLVHLDYRVLRSATEDRVRLAIDLRGGA